MTSGRPESSSCVLLPRAHRIERARRYGEGVPAARSYWAGKGSRAAFGRAAAQGAATGAGGLDDARRTVRCGSGLVPVEGSSRTMAQRVMVSVLRNYVPQDPPKQAPTAAAEPRPTAPAARPEREARIQALEKQVAEFKRQEVELTAATKRSGALATARCSARPIEASRKLRAEMAPVQRELGDLRRAGTRNAPLRAWRGRRRRRHAWQRPSQPARRFGIDPDESDRGRDAGRAPALRRRRSLGAT